MHNLYKDTWEKRCTPLLTTRYDDLNIISAHHYDFYIVLAQNDVNFMTFFTKSDSRDGH